MRARLLALGLMGLAMSAGVVNADDTKAAITQAEVEVTILNAEGTELELPERSVDLGKAAELVAEQGGHEHRIKMTVNATGESAEKVRVALGYQRDGSTVIAKKEIDARSNAPAVLQSGDGTVKVEIIVRPKIPHGGIDMPDGNDPLDGV